MSQITDARAKFLAAQSLYLELLEGTPEVPEPEPPEPEPPNQTHSVGMNPGAPTFFETTVYANVFRHVRWDRLKSWRGADSGHDQVASCESRESVHVESGWRHQNPACDQFYEVHQVFKR